MVCYFVKEWFLTVYFLIVIFRLLAFISGIEKSGLSKKVYLGMQNVIYTSAVM